ncbi:MAG: winged helix-turn-helix domain-containing protein [Candidatus Thorarchaeota archaeon]|jgi:DNA-binding transcriptional ArsR family regulator
MNPKKTSKQIKEFVVVTNPKIIKLLLDETRKEIVFTYLVNQPMTVKQISVAMNKKPGTVLHHVQKLKNAKVIELVETRETPRGIVERYYRATAREFRLGISERMSSYDESPVIKDRVRAATLAMSTLGVHIPEKDLDRAGVLLKKMWDIEEQVVRAYNNPDNHAFQSLPPATRNDISVRMSQYLLSKNGMYQETLKEWYQILGYHLKQLTVVEG